MLKWIIKWLTKNTAIVATYRRNDVRKNHRNNPTINAQKSVGIRNAQTRNIHTEHVLR